MKRHFRFACLLLPFFTLLACEQEEPFYSTPPSLTDYREPYTGLFHFTSHAWSFGMGGLQIYDTVVCNGSVVMPEDADSIMEIHFRTTPPNVNCQGNFWSTCIKVKLHEAGELSFPRFYNNYNHWTWLGKFHGLDTLEVKYSEGGLGSQSGYIIDATRVN